MNVPTVPAVEGTATEIAAEAREHYHLAEDASNEAWTKVPWGEFTADHWLAQAQLHATLAVAAELRRLADEAEASAAV